MNPFRAAYLHAGENGTLQNSIDRAVASLSECRLCPRDCGVNRIQGETGVCRTGRHILVASFGPHYGEEAPLVGHGGSGTIFLTSCNLLCVFCQNDDISHGMAGREVGPGTLAEMMLSLQRRGCHNINFVTPTHGVAQILEALPIAIDSGLTVPLVYNTGGYDTEDTLELLDGIFDIYMPDIKFMDSEIAERFCDAPDYPKVVKRAIAKMHRQVGDLQIEGGIARRGLIVRHLVMPNDQAGTRQAMRFLTSLSPETYVNVMAQYRPRYKADLHPEIDRHPTHAEIQKAEQIAREEGLHRLD